MPFEVTSFNPEPAIEFRAIDVAPGNRGVESKMIPLLMGRARGLPAAIDALIVTSDLQSFDKRHEPRDLMGVAVARKLLDESPAIDLPPPDRIGVILAGDFYTDPMLERRGATGDVDGVWAAFAERCAWVAGVAGNHDLFEGETTIGEIFDRYPNAHLLHGDRVILDDLVIGGVSGIIGKPAKPWRNTVEQSREAIEWLLRDHGGAGPPDILVLHQGPSGDDLGPGHRGSHEIGEWLAAAPAKPDLLVFGHCHWPTPFVTLPASGIPALNVDSRVVVLTRE